jgi:ABC-2 type transport system ATP-binding protein
MTTERREVLRTEGLYKRYGHIEAVRGLDLEVYSGEVFGFLGPNGSGKSTTVGMILGLVLPSAGRVLAFGHDMSKDLWPALRRIGAIIEAPAFYPYLSGYDNLKVIAMAVGDIPKTRIDEMLELVGLSDRGGDPYKTYSLGMKQRLGVASTLLRDPELVILDEPTNGLDPAGTREIRELIPQLARDGRAVFLCSHLLHEVQEVSDRVAIIKNGRLIVQGTVNELIGKGQYLKLRSVDNDALVDALRGIEWVKGVERIDGFLRAQAPTAQAAELNAILAGRGIYLSEITPWESQLEDVFLDLTDEEKPLSALEPDAAEVATHG